MTAQGAEPVPIQSDALARDRALVERVLSNDSAAATELLDVRCGPLIRYLARYYSYEDLPNALYIHLREDDWHNLRTWQGRSTLPGWIRQVGSNLCLGQLKGIPAFQPLEKVGNFISSDSGSPDGPEARMRRLDLIKAVRTLPPRERFLIIQNVFRDRPLAEVAARLGVTRENADVIKHRAVQHLREYLLRKGGRP